MTDESALEDPINTPFWEAATRHELAIQRCSNCGAYQFYGRPFCLTCQSDDVEWVPAAGSAIVYSATTVRMKIDALHDPPYQVALVELDEGPRLLATIVGETCGIGERVRVAWRDRDGAPPLPVFEREGGS